MSSEIKVNTISEYTSANGVVIDGVTLKDSKIGGTITIPGSTGTMALTSDITSGLSEADLWILTTNINSNGILTNFSRPSATLVSYKGTGMSVSSGVWTFPSTGYWLVMVTGFLASPSSGQGSAQVIWQSTNDNFSSSDNIARNNMYITSGNVYDTTFAQTVIDITDTSNDKIRFDFGKGGDGQIQGSTGIEDASVFGFYKLGET